MTRNILPECHADTLLMHIIGYKDSASHQPNIGDVINTMKARFETSKAIGVIDDDKRKPKYVDEFKIIESENNLLLKKHPGKKHYLIIVRPAFEEWIFNAADNVGIDPGKYGIRNLKYFRDISKNINVDKNDDVKQFLNAIKQKKDSPFNTISKWIDNINDIHQ